MNGKKIIKAAVPIILSGAMVLSVSAAESEALSFDEKNIALSFGVLSDVHICRAEFYGEWEQIHYSEDKFVTAVNFLKNDIGEKNMKALVIGGDVADTLGPVDMEKTYEVLKKCVDPEKTEVIATPGNHDVYYSTVSYLLQHDPQNPLAGKNGFVEYNLFAEKLGDYVYRDKSLTSGMDLIQGYYHTVKNGFHFLSMVCISGDPSEAALDWTKKQLDIIRDSGNKGKPVFVVSHAPVTEKTVQALKDYPEIVFLTGHTHGTVNGECVTQYQDSFTAVHCGALKNSTPEFGKIEVDKNGVIRYSTYYMTYTETADEAAGYPDRTYTVTPFNGGEHIFTVNKGKSTEAAATEEKDGNGKKTVIAAAAGAAVLAAGAAALIVIKKRKAGKKR